MQDLSHLALRRDIEDTIVGYWREVDTNWGAGAADFFAEDGVFESENMKLDGRDEVRSFYDWRRSRGERVARHIVNNLQVRIDDDSHAIASYIMTIFAADGVPVLPVSAPNLISDVTEKLVRNGSGWLIERKTFRTLFKGEVPATVMPAEVLEEARSARGAAKGAG